MALTRRNFLALSAAAPFALSLKSFGARSVPVGLEMYVVRDELKKDPEATVRAVAAMGYQGAEFYAPYYEWTETQTKQMRKLLDELGIRCFSTHNDEKFLHAENLAKTQDMNMILGSKYVVQAWADPKGGLDHWKAIADNLNAAAEKLEASGLRIGYHNHQAEFTPVDGQRPIELIAKSTKPSITLQLDVGTCLEAGSDPVGWIRSNPGRIRSMHCKDWSRQTGYKVLLGDGAADWKSIFEAAESVGGIEYYLVEQEEGDGSQLDIAKMGLQAFQKEHRG